MVYADSGGGYDDLHSRLDREAFAFGYHEVTVEADFSASLPGAGYRHLCFGDFGL